MKNLSNKQKILIGVIAFLILTLTFVSGPYGPFRKQEIATADRIEEIKSTQDENMRKVTGEVKENELEEPSEPVEKDEFSLNEKTVDMQIASSKDLNYLVNKSGIYNKDLIWQFGEVRDQDSWVDEKGIVSISAKETNPKLKVYVYPKDFQDLKQEISINVTNTYVEPVVEEKQETSTETAKIETKQDIKEQIIEINKEVSKEEKIEKIEELEQIKEEAIQNTSGGQKDKYLTDPTPPGKPSPVEPQEVEVDESVIYTATISIRCDTILNNLDLFNQEKIDVLPTDGTILGTTTVNFHKGQSVFDVLDKVVKENKIHMEYEFTPIYNSVYIEGINNLYEFDCGPLSGWMYKVNGWFPNYGASRYQLSDGDVINWVYTCDLGDDVGDTTMTGGN